MGLFIQGVIEPGRGIVRIEFFGYPVLFGGAVVPFLLVKGLAEITAQKRTGRVQGRGDFKIRPSLGKVPLADILVEGPGGIWVLPASSGIYEMTCLDDEQRYALLDQLDGFEDRFDTVIIDNAAGISRDVQFFAGAAREVMVVTDREPTSITDAYATIKVLSQRRTNRHFHLLVNNVHQESDALDVYRRLTQVADRFLDVSISLFGNVPRDENLNRAVMARRPLLELFPDSPAAERIAELADKFLHSPPPEGLDGGMKMFWERLFRQGNNDKEGQA